MQQRGVVRGWPQAGMVLGAGWLVVGAAIGIVVRFGVPSPAELLVDVNGLRSLWVGAMTLQTAQQLLLIPFLIALTVALRPLRSEQIGAIASYGLSAVFFAVSGIVHGVFGVHLAKDTDDIGAIPASTVELAEVTHAIADTAYFAGILATALGTFLVCRQLATTDATTRRLRRLGHVAIACALLQFGWFFISAMGAFGALGGALQGAWFIGVGRWLADPRATEPTPTRAIAART